jgi:hypothetical protein
MWCHIVGPEPSPEIHERDEEGRRRKEEEKWEGVGIYTLAIRGGGEQPKREGARELEREGTTQLNIE